MDSKPINRSGMKCPRWRQPVSECCHECELYTQIIGIHPTTGDYIDKWMCATVANVQVTIDAGKQAMVGAATTQALRNDLHVERQEHARLLSSKALPPAIEKAS
jgi:hypothetical protein